MKKAYFSKSEVNSEVKSMNENFRKYNINPKWTKWKRKCFNLVPPTCLNVDMILERLAQQLNCDPYDGFVIEAKKLIVRHVTGQFRKALLKTCKESLKKDPTSK